MKLFLSPHNDDETLFGSLTLMHEKPTVVICTDSARQEKRGEPITADQRWQETQIAMMILDCEVIRLGIPDDELTPERLKQELGKLGLPEHVWAPAVQGGNPDHDIVGQVAQTLYPKILTQYATYTKESLVPKGNVELKFTDIVEYRLKLRAMEAYRSQARLPATRPHFDAVKGVSEWYI